MADDASLFASMVEKYEAADARFLVVDTDYYGPMSNDALKYLDDRHERQTLADGSGVWPVAHEAAPARRFFCCI